MSKNKFNPYKFRKKRTNQTGRGLYGRFRGSYMIPVNPNTSTDNSNANTSFATPVAASEERAESLLKEEVKQARPQVKLVKVIKRGKSKKRFIKRKSSKRKTHKKTFRKKDIYRQNQETKTW